MFQKHINEQHEIMTHLFSEAEDFPNNGFLPVIIMENVFKVNDDDDKTEVENAFLNLFKENDWAGSWVNGLYNYHHYHSTAHEVLGIASGWVKVQFGGPRGKTLRVSAGDVIIIPAGVAHKNAMQSSDFSVVGAYPEGQSPDMKYGFPGERSKTDKNIKSTSLPAKCPVFGTKSPMTALWKMS